jgi:hypothetical protein
MKISSISPEQKTKLLAKLDGYKNITQNKYSPTGLGENKPNSRECLRFVPDYLTSYNAIIPLVQKLNFADIVDDQLLTLFNIEWPLSATASQLCDAVLIATGKAEL